MATKKKDDPSGDMEPPGALARIGRGMTDLYEPAVSLYYGLLGSPGQQAQYDARRKKDEDLYLRGLLGTAIPEELRGAVPDVWRAVGQNAPFLALGPGALTRQALTKAATQTAGWAALGQPAMYAPELWDYFKR